jgi:hypothetical protein
MLFMTVCVFIVIFVVSCNCSAWVLCGGCSFFPYAARQGEGCGKVSLPCGGIFFMPRHSGAPFWRVRGLLFCHALCLLFLLSGVLKHFSGSVYISRKKGQKVTRVLKLFLLLWV